MEDLARFSLVQRMLRAARFDRTVFAEVAQDDTATSQAVLAVVLSSLASGLGTFLGWLAAPLGIVGVGLGIPGGAVLSGSLLTGALVSGLIVGPVLAVVGWLIWAAVAWWVGSRLINPQARLVQFMPVARALAFAQAPNAAGILGFIPFLGFLIRMAVLLWLLGTGFLAIRETMTLTDGQAIATMIIGFIALVVVTFVIGGVVIGGAIGAGLAAATLAT